MILFPRQLVVVPIIVVLGKVDALDLLEDEMGFCTTVFGIAAGDVAQNVANSNVVYGSLTPEVTRIMWPNGEVDPWHCLAVLDVPPKSGQKTLFVDGASHHAWTHPTSDSDQMSVELARVAIRYQILLWVKTNVTV